MGIGSKKANVIGNESLFFSECKATHFTQLRMKVEVNLLLMSRSCEEFKTIKIVQTNKLSPLVLSSVAILLGFFSLAIICRVNVVLSCSIGKLVYSFMSRQRQILTMMAGPLKRLLQMDLESCESNTIVANYKRKAPANQKQVVISSAFTWKWIHFSTCTQWNKWTTDQHHKIFYFLVLFSVNFLPFHLLKSQVHIKSHNEYKLG